MSGLLDLYAAQAGPSGPALIQTPSTPGERFSAEMGAATAPDRYFNLNGSRRNWYGRTIDELKAETGQAHLNPLDPPTREEMFKDGVAVPTTQIQTDRLNKLIEANRALREVKPDAINAEGIDTFIGVEGDAARQKAAELHDTGNGFFAFAGGALALTPENIGGMMLPPSRLVLGAVPIARGFMSSVLREGLYQGAANAGLTAATTGLDVLARKETGTAPTTGEVAADIAMGFAGGAVLGAGFHALHAGPRALWERWTALPEKVRDNAPLEVKDAMTVLQQDAIYSNANRLGLPWDLHERYQGKALDAIMRGRMPDLGELRPGDPGMTGLGTVLRHAPSLQFGGDDTWLAGMARGDVKGAQELLHAWETDMAGHPRQAEGIKHAKERLESAQRYFDQLPPRSRGLDLSLPNASINLPSQKDIMGHVAAESPKDWERLGAARKELADTQAKLDKIEGDPAWVVSPGTPDKATARVLADLESRLEKAKSHDEQARIADQIDGIRESLTPATERAKLTAQREELQGEVDSLMRRFERRAGEVGDTALDVGAQLEKPKGKAAKVNPDLAEPGDLTKQLQAAEFNRQIRMAQEAATPARTEVNGQTRTATDKGGLPVETPEIEAAAKAVMEGKGGALADFRKAVAKEMDGLDLEMKDAEAAMRCVMNGGGIP